MKCSRRHEMGWYTHLFQFVQTSLRECYKYLVPTYILFHDFFRQSDVIAFHHSHITLVFLERLVFWTLLNHFGLFLTFFDTFRPFQSNSTNLCQGEIAATGIWQGQDSVAANELPFTLGTEFLLPRVSFDPFVIVNVNDTF